MNLTKTEAEFLLYTVLSIKYLHMGTFSKTHQSICDKILKDHPDLVSVEKSIIKMQKKLPV